MRQNRLAGVAIEDDEVEVLDLAPEQIGDGEGDQRQFVDRRAVGRLFRRSQNREMDEIDVRVGFQEIAPHALALVRLAGDEQHAQFVANALDRDDRLVVEGRQLARDRRRLELENVRARMVDRRRDPEGLSDRGADRGERLPVAAHGQRRRLARTAAVDHAQGDRLVLADDAEARRLDELDAAVALFRMPCDEDMQRRVETQRADRGGNVVRDSVGDDDRPADAFGRRVAQRGPQRREQLGALIVRIIARGLDEMRFHVVERAEPLFEFGARLGRLAFAVAESIAPRAIDHDRDDVLQRPAVLALQRGVEQAEQQQRRRERPPSRRAWTPP